MKKNKILSILVVFIVALFGFGKSYLDSVAKKNADKTYVKGLVAESNDKSEKSLSSKKNKNYRKKDSESVESSKYNIDYEHVIGGDQNHSGKVTGGHSLLKGDVRIVKKIGQPAKNGVYRATVEIRDSSGKWQQKTSNGGVNTMFPSDWDEARIISEINSAWENRRDVPGRDKNMWQGLSKSKVLIRGYKTPRITAYPVYENR